MASNNQKNPPQQIKQHNPATNQSQTIHDLTNRSNQSTISNLINLLTTTIQNELKFKKIIQRAQKMDFMSNIPPQNKIHIKHSLFINIFLISNSALYGIWMFSNQYYRKFKYLAFYMLGITYLGLSFSIFWEDMLFINKISTKNDAYKSQIKYVLRKQCLQNVTHLQRLDNKREIFQKLNLQFEQFHLINKDNKIVSLLS